MATRRENIKGLMQNTRTRSIVILTTVIVVLAIGIGFLSLRTRVEGPGAKAVVGGGRGAERVESIPGALNPTEEYVKLIEKQNIEQAAVAKRTGGSAVPTIIRSELYGEGKTLRELEGQRGVGFAALTRAQEGGGAKGLWIEKVRKAGCSLEAVREARAQGVTAAELREAGCTAEQLLAGGYNLAELIAGGFTAAELRAAGFTAEQLRAAGMSADDLRKAGFSACELKAAGFSAEEMKKAGYSVGELKGAGFADDQLGTTEGYGNYSEAQIKGIDCSPKSIKQAMNAGVSLKVIKDVSGCTLKELRAAGIPARDLKDLGISAEDLRAAGFSASQLRVAGFSPADLRDAGFSTDDIRKAGFTPLQLRASGVGTVEDDEAALTPEQQREQRLQKILAEQAKRVSAQRLTQEIATRQGAMTSKANGFLASWDQVSPQSMIVGTREEEKIAPVTDTTAKGTTTSKDGKEDEGPTATVIRPGDILFGVMDTAINSDEPGPILATIVSGQFKGARLIGTLRLPDKGEKVIITFNTLTLPGIDKAIPISAVAIDPRTARTALSTHTDKHTLSRWGGLFAASFLEGMGNAFEQQGTSVSVPAGGGTTVTVGTRNLKENTFIALGKVGQRFSQVLGQNVNRKPTVTVNSGTSVGVLFTTEAKVPIQEAVQSKLNRAIVSAMFG